MLPSILLFGLTTILPRGLAPVEVELLELNRVVSWVEPPHRCALPMMSVTLSQWIAWRRYGSVGEGDSGWHCWCWRRHHELEVASRHGVAGWQVLLMDGPPIVARIYRETWTSYDPEIEDAGRFPKSSRVAPIGGWQR
jgi:hypothetical protein